MTAGRDTLAEFPDRWKATVGINGRSRNEFNGGRPGSCQQLTLRYRTCVTREIGSGWLTSIPKLLTPLIERPTTADGVGAYRVIGARYCTFCFRRQGNSFPVKM